MDQKAIGWIDPGALLIGLFCDPALVVSLVTNKPTEKTNLKILRGRARAARFDVMYALHSLILQTTSVMAYSENPQAGARALPVSGAGCVRGSPGREEVEPWRSWTRYMIPSWT